MMPVALAAQQHQTAQFLAGLGCRACRQVVGQAVWFLPFHIVDDLRYLLRRIEKEQILSDQRHADLSQIVHQSPQHGPAADIQVDRQSIGKLVAAGQPLGPEQRDRFQRKAEVAAGQPLRRINLIGNFVAVGGNLADLAAHALHHRRMNQAGGFVIGQRALHDRRAQLGAARPHFMRRHKKTLPFV